MSLAFIETLRKDLEEEISASSSGLSIPIEKVPAGIEADFAINCFRISQKLKIPPEKVAEFIEQRLSKNLIVEKVERIKGFINVRLRSDELHRQSMEFCKKLLAEPLLKPNDRRRILVEFSSPNTNKPLHLGHLRNNAIGDAVSRILERAGHKVVRCCLVNDRGIHICKSMIAYKRFGEGKKPQDAGVKGDHFVGDFYVMFEKEFRRELEELKKSNPELKDKPDEELFVLTGIGAEAQKMLQKWEQGEKEVVELWERMNRWVLEGFDETYKKLGIKFDKIYYESQTYGLGKKIVEDGLNKGIFLKREDGAIFADLEKFSLGKKILLRADGTSVYITQDLGTTLLKQEDFSPDSQIWVVGDEQIHHFKVLFAIIKELGYNWADRLVHLSYGMVNLPSGKMKSREGTVVDADDLLEELFELAKQATIERLESGSEDDESIKERARIISLGALKFMLLKFNAKTTVTFDPQASVKFEGDTGPYVQYACARINSILRKCEDRGIQIDFENANFANLGRIEERELSVQAALYENALYQAVEKLDPSIVANYLLELAKSFSRFYRECSVLNADDEEIRNGRLALLLTTRDILRDGLSLLGIEAPEAM